MVDVTDTLDVPYTTNATPLALALRSALLRILAPFCDASTPPPRCLSLDAAFSAEVDARGVSGVAVVGWLLGFPVLYHTASHVGATCLPDLQLTVVQAHVGATSFGFSFPVCVCTCGTPTACLVHAAVSQWIRRAVADGMRVNSSTAAGAVTL